jgi:hypothetical protein
MIPHRDEASYLRAVALAVLVASSVVALRGHIPAGTLDPVAGAIGGWAALSMAFAMATHPYLRYQSQSPHLFGQNGSCWRPRMSSVSEAS